MEQAGEVDYLITWRDNEFVGRVSLTPCRRAGANRRCFALLAMRRCGDAGGGSSMPASRSVVSVLLRGLGDFSIHPQGRPCGRPAAALRPGSHTAVTGEPASPAGRTGGSGRQVRASSFLSGKEPTARWLLLSEEAVALSLLARSTPMKGELA